MNFWLIRFSTNTVRFIVETNQVQNENNRGRVVIGYVKAFEVKPHSHAYEYIPAYGVLGFKHYYSCSCGEETLLFCIADDPTDPYARCVLCGQSMGAGLFSSTHNHNENNDENILFFQGDDDEVYLEWILIKSLTPK